MTDPNRRSALTRADACKAACMVDVSVKPARRREAVARGEIRLLGEFIIVAATWSASASARQSLAQAVCVPR